MDTTFVNGTTLSDSDWFNDVNRLHYTIFGDPANVAAVVSTFAASQAQQESGSSTAVAVTSGRQQYHPSAAKAWARFSYTGTVLAGYNIPSAVDNGTGDKTVLWNTPFSGVDYAVHVTPYSLAGAVMVALAVGTRSDTGVNIHSRNLSSTFTNADYYNVAAYGDQA